nr:ABC transporter substrate-binding protein [Rhodococcus sp. MS16]
MLSVTFATAAGFVLAACGDSANDESTTSAEGGHAEPGAFPVTIDHKFGSTTIEQAPSRIAAVGIGDADVLLSLGLTPVLVPVWKGSTDDGIGVWADSAVQGAEPTPLANATTEFDIETIIAAAPDLIIAVNNAIDEDLYKQLSAIAPTVLHAADQTDWVLPLAGSDNPYRYCRGRSRTGQARGAGRPGSDHSHSRREPSVRRQDSSTRHSVERRQSARIQPRGRTGAAAYSVGVHGACRTEGAICGQAELRDLRRELRPSRMRLPTLRQLREGSPRDGDAGCVHQFERREVRWPDQLGPHRQ